MNWIKRLAPLFKVSITRMIAFLGLFVTFASNAGRYFRSSNVSVPFILATVLGAFAVHFNFGETAFFAYLGGVFVVTLVFAGILGGRYYSTNKKEKKKMVNIEASEQPYSQKQFDEIVKETESVIDDLTSHPQHPYAWSVVVLQKLENGEFDKENITSITNLQYSYDSTLKTMSLDIKRMFDGNSLAGIDPAFIIIKVCDTEIFSINVAQMTVKLKLDTDSSAFIYEDINFVGSVCSTEN